jgi:ribonuclease HI
MRFEIYTDGSSFIDGDIRKSASGFVIYSNERLICSGGKFFDNGTNNKGEVMAVLLGLEELESRIMKLEKKYLTVIDNIEITVIGDSLLIIEGCRNWIYSWVKNRKNNVLMTASKTPVANGDVFFTIYTKYLKNKRFKISFLHVNSHKLDTAYYLEMHDMIIKYFKRYAKGKRVDALPDKIFKSNNFKSARRTFEKKNGMIISDTELLRLLMHNKEADEVASEYLSTNITKTRKEHTSYGKEKGSKASN